MEILILRDGLLRRFDIVKSVSLLSISLLIFLFNLSKPMIYILDEAKNAECAREMLVSGNYIVPHFNGQIRTDKPPLHYFFMVLSYKIFGVSAFSARFFSAVFGAFTVLISYLFSRKYLGEKTAWFSVIVLLASLHFNFQMRMAVPDPYLILWMTSTFMTFFLFITEKKSVWLWLMYVSFGLGLLTKGPIALGLPGLIMAIFLILTRRLSWQTIRSFRILAGIVIMLVIALPWYWLNYIQSHGVWTEGFFIKHNLERFSNPMEGHSGFILLPLIMVVFGLLPFGVFSIQATMIALKKRTTDIFFFCLVVVFGIVLFFSLSQTKLPNYTAPAYPFVAILIGYMLTRLTLGEVSPISIKWTFGFYNIIAIAIPFIIYFVLKNDLRLSGLKWLWICFIALPLGSLIGWYFFKQKEWTKLITVIAGSFIFSNFLFFGKAYPSVYLSNPVQASINQLRLKPNLVYYKMMNSAYVFNMQRIIPVIKTPEQLKSYLEKKPDATIISRKEYQHEIQSSGKVRTIFEQNDTFENHVTMVFESK